MHIFSAQRLPAWVLVGTVVHLAYASNAHAATALPPVLQAALIAKIFQADETIRARSSETAKLLIVQSDSDVPFAISLDEALGPTQIITQTVTPAELSRPISGVAAIYVSSAKGAELYQKFCTDHGVLSISGNVSLVEAGLVSVAIGMNQQLHPEVVINTRQLAAQRHTLAAALVKLARIVETK